ncbi:hypothetical protein SAMN02910264_01807 [Ruminococcaceae bacterium YAD3003]|nr:hypothetical protein SAMN02910264_01807 [Ruminococcaceae bacterium YAD3003]
MKERNNKKKKGIVKKVFLIIAAILLVWLLTDIIVTEVYAGKIPHHYASAKEGRELMLSNTEYYENVTQIDIDNRLGKSGGTLDELLEASTAEVKSFNIFEKYIIDRRIANMAKTIARNDYELPYLEEIVFIKTDMTVEGMAASGYTHGTQIYLNSTNIMISVIPEAGNFFEQLLWHELFHCLTRNNPEFRSEMYSIIHFTVTGTEYELPPCIKDLYRSNPDVEHHNSYATFNINGQDIDCFVVWIYMQQEDGSYTDDTPVLVPIDGTDTYYLPEQASNFNEVFGGNTDYTIDPEECLADNFKYAMYYGIDGWNGQGYPNPEIIQDIIDVMKK